MKAPLILIALVLAAAPLATLRAQEPLGAPADQDDFQYEADRFADIRILRYQVPGFEALPLQRKKLLYFLSQAGMSGRDIMWDQNYEHNLRIRRTLEHVVERYAGDRETAEFAAFLTYAKQLWFANGIHHHYSGDKFSPRFSPEYFASLLRAVPAAGLPLDEGQDVDGLIALLTPV